MLDFLELEETVGRAWHRLIGKTGSWPQYPDQAVKLADIRQRLAICFRGFGGDVAVQIAPARARTSGHRLGLRQRMALGEEKLNHPLRDEATLMLPPEIALFPDRMLNYDLYVWLAGYMAIMPTDLEAMPDDPLRRDLVALDMAAETAAKACELFPGLEDRYARLCDAILEARPNRRLNQLEQLVEERILSLLKDGAGLPDFSLPAIFPHRAPAGYLPILPVPLWPGLIRRDETASRAAEDEPVRNSQAEGAETGRQIAQREKQDARLTDRSPFILNRFEKILTMAEMVSVDRPSDDSDEQNAKSADELDDLTLGERKGRPAARFRFDLDLPPEAVDRSLLTAKLTYPEWDYRKATYLQDHCSVLAAPVQEREDALALDDEARSLVRRVRRQFEILRPGREMMRAQLDGNDLDLDAVVRSRCDFAAGGQGSERVHLMSRPQANDLAVTILVDVSLSTDAWVDNRRVLDVEKEALLVLANGIAACGDRCSILTFTSRRRSWVRVETVKDFDEAFSPTVEHRIAALKPGFYTRMGAAMRHATAKLSEQHNRKKLLLLLTDGKPNDVDHYEGRFALEDTRRAVSEARAKGVNVFAVTVDREANAYLPALFGHGGFAMVAKLAKLPVALPAIYRMLAG
ncbi:nitric oxide reductase activation protein NorD [Brucella pituitosa]|uniref:nitric oxide reductase activation protein NorD n=1 Tax=Brucella pituitosa TaxID=571256 RepID=UPI000C2794B0|nr:nitric oxide reductase activation protein NorD [Brucella pituitosa]MCK4206126.1 nitric oxide reductase activation protein NorD [Brucella pituitosa]PJO49494.1 protein norD [Brucella pituitosa]PRA85539.1 protein norD [Ochrobactrum sp. MYb29]